MEISRSPFYYPDGFLGSTCIMYCIYVSWIWNLFLPPDQHVFFDLLACISAGLGNLCMVFSQAPPCRPTTFAHGGGLQRWHSGIASNAGNVWKFLKNMKPKLSFPCCLFSYVVYQCTFCHEMSFLSHGTWGRHLVSFFSSSSWVKKGEKSETSGPPKSQQDSHVSVEPIMGWKLGVSF